MSLTPEQIEAIKAEVATWPPPTPEQIAFLARAFAPRPPGDTASG